MQRLHLQCVNFLIKFNNQTLKLTIIILKVENIKNPIFIIKL